MSYNPVMVEESIDLTSVYSHVVTFCVTVTVKFGHQAVLPHLIHIEYSMFDICDVLSIVFLKYINSEFDLGFVCNFL